MKEQSKQPQNPPAGDEQPEVYSLSQDKDGSFRFSRREIFALGAAVGGALVIKGVCPRFAARSGAGELAQAGMLPLPRVPIHTEPSIASNIAATLQHDDLVRLVSDNSDLSWVEVATQSGQRGWVERGSLDFSQAIASNSPNFDLDSTPGPAPTEEVPQLTCSARSIEADNEPNEPLAAGELPYSVQLIRNRSFESGKDGEWAEYTTGSIISQVVGTYHGDWAAWFGGDNAQERLTQLFRVPPLVEDAQQLTFYLYVLTTDGGVADDVFNMRFLNAAGNPFPASELTIADNNWPAGRYKWTIDITGLRGVADQDIRLQFECINDSSLNTSFYLDLVSLNVTYGTYVYLPLVVRQPLATPTPIPCTSYCGSDSCPSYCSSDSCSSYCSSDSCPSYCSSYCGSDCGWDCPGNCYGICLYNYSW